MKVDFDEASHTYTVDGTRIPSVTEILGDLSVVKRLDPAILAAAAERGKLVHKVVQYWNEKDLDDATVDESARPYLLAWQRFCHDHKFRPLLTEQMVYSQRWGFAGTFDVLGTWQISKHTRFCLPEVKSGVSDPSHGPQTAAYVHAAIEMEMLDDLRQSELPQRCAVHLQPDGYYKLDRFSDPTDWANFLAALTCYRFKQKHGLI